MVEIEKRTFAHDGKTFELRLYRASNGFNVVAFLDEQQVSPCYGVSFTTHADYFSQHHQRLTEHLFDIARSDIALGMYFGS